MAAVKTTLTFHVIIMGKHVGLTVFICGLEVKTTKVDNHQFTKSPYFSDGFEERTNKNTKKPLHVHYEHSMAKQLFRSEIC